MAIDGEGEGGEVGGLGRDESNTVGGHSEVEMMFLKKRCLEDESQKKEIGKINKGTAHWLETEWQIDMATEIYIIYVDVLDI